MRGGAQERPRSVLPRFPPPGREVKAWGGGGWRGGAAAAAAARGSAVQSSAHGAAGAAASATGKLKGKGDDRVTRLPAEAPPAWVLARTPAQGPPPKSRHPELALRLRPERSRKGAGSALRSASRGAHSPRPSLFPTRSQPRAAPGCPSRPTLLSTRRVQPQSAPLVGMVPLSKMPGPRGCPGEKMCGLTWVWALGLPSWDLQWLPPSVPPPHPRHKLSQACFGGKHGRGHLQVSFTDFGTITVSAPRVSPPWATGRAPHPLRRRLPRRERGREKKLGFPCPSPAGVRPGQGTAPAAPSLGAVLDEGD